VHSLLATLFSSRGRPRASAAAPLLQRPALFLPLLLVPIFVAAGLVGLVHALPGATSARSWTGTSDADAVPPRTVLAASLSSVFTPEVTRWSAEILTWAAEYQLAPDVIATVMQIESCGDPTARSSAGAQGLFQVMPFHFAAGEIPADPQVNARRGLSYLARSLQLAGDDLEAGFAGYNGGHGVIALPPTEWPEETQRYAHWATGILREAQAGSGASPTLQAWLDAGGAYLCQRAASAGLSGDA
jgi:soluble lytic murein transglycosylase-like protein